MEHVQDVVDNLETEMVRAVRACCYCADNNANNSVSLFFQLAKFMEDDDKPVSSLFTAQIPNTGGPPAEKTLVGYGV